MLWMPLGLRRLVQLQHLLQQLHVQSVLVKEQWRPVSVIELLEREMAGKDQLHRRRPA